MSDKTQNKTAEEVLIEFVPNLKLSEKHYSRLIGAIKSYAKEEVKKACKAQREICADEIEDDTEVEQVIIDCIRDNVRNAPSPFKSEAHEAHEDGCICYSCQHPETIPMPPE